MSTDETISFAEAVDMQSEKLIDRVIGEARKRGLDLDQAITEAFILFINKEDDI